jgi:putative transposase
MTGKYKHTAEFKLQVALEAHKGLKTVGELSSHYQVHPSQIHLWKKQLKEGGRALFAPGAKRGGQDMEALQSALYEEIGRLKFELDWLKKKAAPFN